MTSTGFKLPQSNLLRLSVFFDTTVDFPHWPLINPFRCSYCILGQVGILVEWLPWQECYARWRKHSIKLSLWASNNFMVRSFWLGSARGALWSGGMRPLHSNERIVFRSYSCKRSFWGRSFEARARSHSLSCVGSLLGSNSWARACVGSTPQMVKQPAWRSYRWQFDGLYVSIRAPLDFDEPHSQISANFYKSVAQRYLHAPKCFEFNLRSKHN